MLQCAIRLKKIIKDVGAMNGGVLTYGRRKERLVSIKSCLKFYVGD